MKTAWEDIRNAFTEQIGYCKLLGSPFTALILEYVLEDLDGQGPFYDLVKDWQLPPIGSGLALRVAGALNALVLTGTAPSLARYYPPDGRRFELDELKSALVRTGRDHAGFIAQFLTRPVQTNEIRRSCCLTPGFMEIAKWSGLPLNLLEIGACAGLNLMWDKYSYTVGGTAWSVPGSPITLDVDWTGPKPDFAGMPDIASRKGVDIHPIDIWDDHAVTRGLSYIWPDQPDRVHNFKTAVAMARESGLTVDHHDAAQWLPGQLESRPPGVCTVIYHSIMWQYMPGYTQDAVRTAIEHAGHDSTKDRPMAWLYLEPVPKERTNELAVKLWPGGHAQRLGTCHPHGATMNWLGGLV